jgi:hypothetical protein
LLADLDVQILRAHRGWITASAFGVQRSPGWCSRYASE